MIIKRSLIFLVCILAAFTTPSAADEIQLASQATQKSKYEFNTTFLFASDANGTAINLNPQLGYFAWDQIQIGFTGSLNNSDFKTSGNLGLSATNYFSTDKNLGSFVSQAILTTYGRTPNNQFGFTSLGIAFFATPNVAYKTIASLNYPLKGVIIFDATISGGLAFYF